MLHELIKRGLQAEPGFAAKYVKWAIVCGPAGGLSGVVPLVDTADKKSKGRYFAKCPDMKKSMLQAGGMSHFLAESAQVVTLLSATDEKKIVAKHRYFVEMIRKASGEVAALAWISTDYH